MTYYFGKTRTDGDGSQMIVCPFDRLLEAIIHQHGNSGQGETTVIPFDFQRSKDVVDCAFCLDVRVIAEQPPLIAHSGRIADRARCAGVVIETAVLHRAEPVPDGAAGVIDHAPTEPTK